MYIELFILDNFIMDALVLRLACALASAPSRAGRTALFSALGALIALAGLAWPPVGSAWGKLVTALVMALALPFNDARGYIRSVLALTGAALIVGGAALTASLASGGGMEEGVLTGGWPLRAALITAAVAAFAPAFIQRLRRRDGARYARIIMVFDKKEYHIRGLWDTGCNLFEPVSGRPVIVACIPELAELADIPVPASTVIGEAMLAALRPKVLLIDGRPSDALVAITDKRLRGTDAVIPHQIFGEAI